MGLSIDNKRIDGAADIVHRRITHDVIGAGTWIDVMAIPADADNVDNAHKFLDYLMRPEVIAGITNYVSYPNGNADALQFVDKEIREDKAIYPAPETLEKLYSFKVMPPKVQRVMNRVWTKLKTGQ